MSAETLIKNMRAAYKSMKSYADSGSAAVVPSPNKESSVEFNTYFTRPDRVRFEWRDWHPFYGKTQPANENVIWSDDRNTQTYFGARDDAEQEQEQRENPETITTALAGASAVSAGSALVILKLLFPECIKMNNVWYEMQGARLIDEEDFGGHLCVHIQGTSKRAKDTEVWLGKDDFIVRRVRQHTEITAEEGKRLKIRALEALEKAGMPTDNIPEETFAPRKYYHEYNYHKIAIDQDLPKELFRNRIINAKDESAI